MLAGYGEEPGAGKGLTGRPVRRRQRMFDIDGNGKMDPGEEYLAFRIWEEMCLEDGEEEQDDRDGEDGLRTEQ